MSSLRGLLFLSLLSVIVGEVTIFKAVQTIYDRSPKLKIRGSGFDGIDDHDIRLVIGDQSSPPLVVDKDYMITKDNGEGGSDGVILKLLANRKWVDLTSRIPPVSLVLSSVSFASNPDQNLLFEPIVVARVLATPTVKPNPDLTLYQTASNELRINGTGFVGAKKVDLYFQPPLVKEVAYEDVSQYPLMRDQVVLRLRHGYEWSETPGPLSVIGIDTGGGPVKVNSDEGVQVAMVQENLAEHSVTVEDTADVQLIYCDEPRITITGTGFNTLGNLFRWGNGLLGNNINYTTISTSETSVVLGLSSGSLWRKNFENLPGTLTLLAVNAGGGFVAVGPTNSGKGRDIAMVFERPDIYTDQAKLFRTHSHELHIKGTGFPSLISGFKPALEFNTGIKEGVDYTIRVVSRTEIEVTLKDQRAWGDAPGPLIVTKINTRGDEKGWITFTSGRHIAEIVADKDASNNGGVEVIPMGVKVYQSVMQEEIPIVGEGFVDGMDIVLDPPMVKGVDYTVEVISKNSAKLHLVSGKKWRNEPGLIIAKKIITPDKQEYTLADADGIRIAVVLADPVVTATMENYHESQSKLIVIEGHGFTNVADTKVLLRPCEPSSYKVLNVFEDSIRIQLNPGKSWVPGFASLKNEDSDKKVPLQISSIDTGAGAVTFGGSPITIGYIIKDREGVVCDDSCEFAFDGVCDDGTEPNDEFYYQNYFSNADDDMGGFYGDDDNIRKEHNKQQGTKNHADPNHYSNGYYDDYYMENEDYQVSACVEGTDCTDCGGVDAIIDYNEPLSPDSGVDSCTNTCMYPRDGVCDDPRGTKYCDLGTDCQDCGPVGAENFTRIDDDGWWDDDDDYWNFNDGNFLEQTKGLDANRHKVRTHPRTENESPGAVFLDLLEGMVYAVGSIFAAAALYLVYRWYNGQSIPFVNQFNSELSVSEFEMRPTQRMPITPDEFRT